MVNGLTMADPTQMFNEVVATIHTRTARAIIIDLLHPMLVHIQQVPTAMCTGGQLCIQI